MKHILTYELFLEQKGIPETLKSVMKTLKTKIIDNNLINKSFKLHVDWLSNDYLPISFYLNVNVTNSNLEQYNAKINLFEILENQFENFNIDILTQIFNINKLLSVIGHELHHVYELLIFKGDFMKSSYIKDKNVNSVEILKKDKIFKDFLSLVYYNFSHELRSRNSQIYHLLYNTEYNTLDDLYAYITKDKSFSILESLNNFDHHIFINKFYDQNYLLYITNIFNDVMGYKKITLNKLISYYKKWEETFKNNYFIYKKKLNKIIEEVLKDKENSSITEIYCYDESLKTFTLPIIKIINT